jgi:hypothetical protein
MPIVAEFGPDVQEYAEYGKEHTCHRPESCPICQAIGQMIGHGYYWRKPKGLERCWVIRVKRWKCKACGHTVGAVPSFLLFFRHYLLEIIQSVVVGRFELEYSWAATFLGCADEGGTPVMRTMQRWCGGLTAHALEWLGAMETTMAEQDSQSAWLDAQGEAGRMRNPAQALLRGSLHLLAWAKGRWREVERFVLNDRLRFLWYWGNWRLGLSRLV